MIKKLLLFLCLFGIILCSLAYASEIIIPATQIQMGNGSINLYYGQTSQKLNFQLNSTDEIKAGNTGNGYFSSVTNDVESFGQSKSLNVKYIVNPGDGLYYWLKLGTGYYDLEIPSETVKNHLKGQDSGWNAGLGIRLRLLPDTIVTPAIAVEISLDYGLYGLDMFSSGNNVAQAINDKLEMTQIQTAFVVSKNAKNFEGYGGLKVFRTYMSLKDRVNLTSVSGYKDDAGLFLGIKMKVFPKEHVVLEGSFLGEAGLFAGWNVEF